MTVCAKPPGRPVVTDLGWPGQVPVAPLSFSSSFLCMHLLPISISDMHRSHRKHMEHPWIWGQHQESSYCSPGCLIVMPKLVHLVLSEFVH